MLAQPVPVAPASKLLRSFTPGLPDEVFLRGKVPMTKRDVRASILARLQPAPGEVLWDVGAGTGSVTVEMALAASMGKVYAVEMNPEGTSLIRQNRERFGAWNIHVVEGAAPAKLADLPAPDAVFLGGTKGSMLPSIECALSKNPSARFCVTGILLETAMEAIDILEGKGMAVTVTQIQSSETRPVGGKHMMMANNPVFVVSGNWPAALEDFGAAAAGKDGAAAAGGTSAAAASSASESGASSAPDNLGGDRHA
jgi:precorrin-6Y C5,15-methyltransferase (decarboxylating)